MFNLSEDEFKLLLSNLKVSKDITISSLKNKLSILDILNNKSENIKLEVLLFKLLLFINLDFNKLSDLDKALKVYEDENNELYDMVLKMKNIINEAKKLKDHKDLETLNSENKILVEEYEILLNKLKNRKIL